MLTLLLWALEYLRGRSLIHCCPVVGLSLKMFTRHGTALTLAGSNKVVAIAPKPRRRRGPSVSEAP